VRHSSRRLRRRLKSALLRARLPLKGPLARAYLRVREAYLGLRFRGPGEAAPDGLPVPPARLRVLVSGEANLESFLASGREHAAYLRELLEQSERPMEQMERLLDFGCGCGRIARWLAGVQGPHIEGCDYNARLVRWCEENLSFMQVRRTELEPPLPYTNARFDFVYAFSVFTHLSVDLARAWIDELARIVKAGGLLWFTLHGESYRERLLPEQRVQFDAGEIVVVLPEIQGTNFCGAYWPQESVRRMLADRFEVLAHHDPGELENGGRVRLAHDAYLVRRL
jgi:SAM-dependent methyltransferase